MRSARRPVACPEAEFDDWPDTSGHAGVWKVFGLIGDGPDVTLSSTCERNATRCPRTVQLLSTVPGIVRAGFSVLLPGAHIYPHRDAGGELRCHLPLGVRPGAGIRIGGDDVPYRDGRCLVFPRRDGARGGESRGRAAPRPARRTAPGVGAGRMPDVSLVAAPPSSRRPVSRDYELREFSPGDETSILETFNLVFRGARSTKPARTLRTWRWAFLENPGGWRIWLALSEGQVVAQSAGLGYRLRLAGRDDFASQSVDSMVHPAHRRGLKNPGLFVRTVQRYVAAYGGERDAFFFGWPNRSARRLGSSRLGYRLIRHDRLLGLELEGDAEPMPEGVHQVERLDARAGELWERCAAQWGASVVRDERFLRWRFSRAPHRRYELLAVRGEDGATCGYAACRAASWPLPGSYVVVDWLVPDSATEVGELLQRAIRARALAQRRSVIAVLLPPWSEWFGRLRRAGFQSAPRAMPLVARCHRGGLDEVWLRRHWWYQLAESDFV